MIKRHINWINIVLVAVLMLGGTASAFSGAADCLPKACCCTRATQPQSHLGNEGPVHCPPSNPAPCCQIEQDQPRVHIAITLAPNIHFDRQLIGNVALEPSVAENRNTLSFSRLLDHGRPKGPPVPIYLQTQTILC